MIPRSYLYVPGTRPDRFEKALASGADAVILDLEDAVPPDAKETARANVAEWLRTYGAQNIVVRVNGGALLDADVRAVADAGARVVSLPKASPDEVDRLRDISDLDVIALIETAAGVFDARQIAQMPGVVRLAIGEADLSAEIGIHGSEDILWSMRAQVILASTAAGLDAPVGPVTTDFNDLDALRVSTETLHHAGFGARAAIHPAQVKVINDVFTPSPEDVARAQRIVELAEAAGGHATVDDDGRMLDEAFVKSARRIIERAGG